LETKNLHGPKKGHFKTHRASKANCEKNRSIDFLISLQSLCNYLNKKPKEVRLRTVELICTALDCELKDFCSITPSESLLKQDHSEVKKLSWQTTPLSKRSQDAFPDPKLYEL